MLIIVLIIFALFWKGERLEVHNKSSRKTWREKTVGTPLQIVRIKWKCIIKIERGIVDWIHLAQDREHGLALVNMVMIFRVS
jgi:hypothetical protein